MNTAISRRFISLLFKFSRSRSLVTITMLIFLPAIWSGRAGQATSLPPGFQESIAFSGLDTPTVVRFSPDGRVFVAEKSGVIKVFDNLGDASPETFADLNVNVYNFWDRGLLGIALDPGFPASPYIYVLYAYDGDFGGQAPKYGTPGIYSDPCPDPPGPFGDGCVVSGRLSRLTADGNFMTGAEKVLIEDWCQQYPSHSTGALVFGPDGALYASGGDGADFNLVDYGQNGNPLNPCGDPPGGVGAVLSPPTAEGGSLRSQDLRTTGDPVGLDGAIIRVDPATGAGLPDNPLAGNPDLNARRIIAYGLRNPFRLAFRPGSEELWSGDVGWFDWEEVNRIRDVNDAVVENFGWPCYEGRLKQGGYDSANLNLCESLYQSGAVINPYYRYNHNNKVVPGEACQIGSSSISGLAFQPNSNSPYPGEYDGALFFSDYSRNCIWAMLKGTNGLPDPANILTFISNAASPVDLAFSPSGELYYVDIGGGTVRRVKYFSGNQPPTARITASPTSGNAPLQVSFDGSVSSDPDPGDTLSYAWDLDDDGLFDDGSTAMVNYTYSLGTYNSKLRVTDSGGISDTASVVISAGNTPPVASIDLPVEGTTWLVGQSITFSGSARDEQQGNLPAAQLIWQVVMMHCPSNCHPHLVQEFTGVARGSFQTPDHEYPSHLELRLTATDSQGLKDTKILKLYPKTALLTFKTNPAGLQLVVNGGSQNGPFSRTVIVGSRNSISATTPQTVNGTDYQFVSWSDGGAQTHDIFAPAAVETYTAHFARVEQQLFISLSFNSK